MIIKKKHREQKTFYMTYSYIYHSIEIDRYGFLYDSKVTSNIFAFYSLSSIFYDNSFQT